jgi:hypothetical protein
MGWVREDYVDFTEAKTFRLRRLFLPRQLLMEASPFRWSELQREGVIETVVAAVSHELKRRGYMPPFASLVMMRVSLERDGVFFLIEDESFDVVEAGALVPEHEVTYDW